MEKDIHRNQNKRNVTRTEILVENLAHNWKLQILKQYKVEKVIYFKKSISENV